MTPDGRYLVVRGRLWRRADPMLTPEVKQRSVNDLMAARRAVRDAKQQNDARALGEARARVQAAKERLGERGPVWWNDDQPDLTRFLAKNTEYAEWFDSQS